MTLPVGCRAWESASTAWRIAWRLTFCLVLAGCNAASNNRPSPATFNTPPLNAYALSGGKITHFIPDPGLLADPVDKSTLEACRQLPITSGIARHTYVIVHGRGKTVPITALVVGDYVLVTVGEITRMLDIPTTDSKGGLTLFPGSAQSIILGAGDRYAQIGSTRLRLSHPMYWAQNGGLVLTLPDTQRIFRQRSAQRKAEEFKVIKIADHLKPGVGY